MADKLYMPDIRMDPLVFSSGPTTRVDILFEVPYHSMKFEKEGNSYVAYYSMAVLVKDTDDAIVAEREWSKSLSVKTYAETNLDMDDPALQSFTVKPGEYTFEVTITDGRSLQHRTVRKKIAVREQPAALSVSDPMMLAGMSDSGAVRSISPVHPDDIGKGRSFTAFYEVYDSTRGDTIRALTFLRHFDVPYDRDRQSTPFTMWNTFIYSGMFAPRFDSVAVMRDTMFISDGKPGQVFAQFNVPSPGGYQLLTKVYRYRGTMLDTAILARTLMVHRRDFPDARDVDDMIAPLRYIAYRDELDSLKAPSDPQERLKRLNEYWSKTLNPRLRDDFYTRVRQANIMFSSHIDGWRTPMGMVYIVIGPPDQVTCQSYDEYWGYEYQQSLAVFSFGITPEMRFAERPIYILANSPGDSFWSNYIYRWRR